jgi:hypothetical protein
MEHHDSPLVPVSWGELLDKLTILDIKQARIARADARANVEKERMLLDRAGAPVLARADLAPLLDELRAVNEALWEIEDAIREEEAEARFGADFIRLARSVYKRNDERAAIKRRINAVLGSDLIEEKSYAGSEGRSFSVTSRPPSGPKLSVVSEAGSQSNVSSLSRSSPI